MRPTPRARKPPSASVARDPLSASSSPSLTSSLSDTIVDLAGGIDAVLDIAETHARERTSASLGVAVSLARHAERARQPSAPSASTLSSSRRRIDDIERDYAQVTMEDSFYTEISRAARAIRRRDKAKPKVRARDRACNQPKARQGLRKSDARNIHARSCVACERLAAQGELFRVVRVKLRADDADEDEMVVKDGERYVSRMSESGTSGRSAYVCKTRACVDRAVRVNAIARILKINIPQSLCATLKAEATAFEEANGVDTRPLVYLRPDGASARWTAPGEWVAREDPRARGIRW
jgi:predicted RNA-binding protein YlxR (DUF448 family)